MIYNVFQIIYYKDNVNLFYFYLISRIYFIYNFIIIYDINKEFYLKEITWNLIYLLINQIMDIMILFQSNRLQIKLQKNHKFILHLLFIKVCH